MQHARENYATIFGSNDQLKRIHKTHKLHRLYGIVHIYTLLYSPHGICRYIHHSLKSDHLAFFINRLMYA